jgi:hypothetical protein
MCVRRIILTLTCAGVALVATHAMSQDDAPPVNVDLKLVITVDISPSMSPREQRVQREGYVAAFRQAQLAAAATSGPYGRIAVAYVEWAGIARVVVPWTIVEGAESAERLAARLASRPIRQRLRTSISTALIFSADLLRNAPFAAERSVIDISGNGPNNSGPPVVGTRDAVVAEGIVVNGLPIMLDRAGQGFFDTRGLDRYYEDCVIGGPGAFALPVTELDALAATIRRKLLIEIAGATVQLLPVAETQIQPQRRADCLVGERQRIPTAR